MQLLRSADMQASSRDLRRKCYFNVAAALWACRRSSCRTYHAYAYFRSNHERRRMCFRQVHESRAVNFGITSLQQDWKAKSTLSCLEPCQDVFRKSHSPTFHKRPYTRQNSPLDIDWTWKTLSAACLLVIMILRCHSATSWDLRRCLFSGHQRVLKRLTKKPINGVLLLSLFFFCQAYYTNKA